MMIQRLVSDLHYQIKDYFKRIQGDCEVFSAPFAVFLNENNKNYVEPDISVICDKNKISDQGCNGAPDWVIEIVSPSSKYMDYFIKLFKYRTAGVREYWIVDPMKQRVTVYFFEKGSVEDYAFGVDVPVGIYDDFSIRVSRTMVGAVVQEGEQQMKAWVLHGVNDIRYEVADEPQLADNEVLVSVKAAGICGSDIPRIYRTGAHIHPLIPGHEFSGQVAAVGRNADKKWSGKRVGVFPLIPCGNCDACQRQQYELCRSYDYLGSRRDGGFAEFVAVPEWNLILLPDSVSYEQAAMMEPMAVAVHAMRSALSGNGDKTKSIAVRGLGTIGMLLVMFLIEAGYTDIYVLGNKDFQQKSAAGIGIDDRHIYDSRTEDMGAYEWLLTQTKGAGVDVYFECVGKNETISDAILGTAPNGTVQLVGNPASDIVLEKTTYWKILRSQLAVKGSWNSSYTHSTDDDWHYVLDRLQHGKVHPQQCITHVLSLDELEKGFLFMRDKTQEYVKVMVCGG